MKNKFDDLKVGDIVFLAISQSGGRTRRFKKTVSRVTKTMIIVDNYRFRKDGFEVGRECYSTIWNTLERYDEDVWKVEYKERKKEYVLNIKNYKDITEEQIEAIYKILKREK